MSREFVYASKRDLCPVCDRDHGCKIFCDGKVWCLRVTTQSDAPPNYRVVGFLNNGMGASLVPRSDDDDPEYRRKRAFQEEKLQRQQQRQLSTLSIEQRDKAIRRMHSQIGLSKSDRNLLKQTRGMSDEQIDRGLYFSLAPYQDLPAAIPLNFPGVHSSGTTLTNKYQGIACPLFDPEGKAIGIQYRITDEKADDDERYRWLRNSHLPSDGKLPLTFIRPASVVRKQVALIEGTGFKPQIAADKLGQIVIGASGGQHAGSPQQLAKYLEAAEVEGVDTSTLQIYIDGGDVINSHVLNRLSTLVDLLTSWGKQVEIAWWEQETKDDLDIDELEDVSAISYIPVEQFQPLQQFKASLFQAEKEAKQQQKQLKDDKIERAWQKLTSLSASPWKRINKPQLVPSDLADWEKGHIYLVVSAKGTGKTKSIKSVVDKFSNAIAPNARRSLARTLAHNLDLTHLDDLKSFTGSLKVSCCLDSLWQLSPGLLRTNGVFLLDEIDQVLVHAFGSTCNKDGKRPRILKHFEACLAAALSDGLVVGMSADITNSEVALLQNLLNSLGLKSEVRIVLNEYQPPKGDCYYFTDEAPDGLIEQLVGDLKKGKNVYLIDDTKNGIRGCRSVAAYVKSVFPALANSIVEINSDNSGSDAIKAYLENINEASLSTRLLACTPSITSGISIENGHFDVAYGIFYHLPVNQASQALARPRGCKLFKVWVAEQGRRYEANKSLFPAEIKDWYNRNYNANAKFLQSVLVDYNPLTDEWSSDWFEYQCKVFAYQNLCMSDYRRRLKERLKEEGYSVKEVDTGNKTNPDLPLTWEQISLDEASEVANAELLSERELESALAIDSPPPELLPRIRKTLLLKRYGEKIVDAITYDFKVGKEGITHHLTGWEALYLKDKNEKWYSKLKQVYYLIGAKEEAIAADYAREREQLYQTEHFLDSDRHKRRYAGDVTWNARKREARRFIGLHKFLDAETWYEPGDFKGLKSKASKFAFNFFDAIAIDPTNPNLSVTQFYEALVEQLGLEIEKSEWKTELVFDGQGRAVFNKDGTQKRKKYKLRRIGSDSWKWFELFCEHRQTMKERIESASESVATPCENLYQTGGGWNMSQSHTGQEIESDFGEPKKDATVVGVTPHQDELLSSINTFSTESDCVPTTAPNLYETEVGWNTTRGIRITRRHRRSTAVYRVTQSYTGQEIKGAFSTQKNAPAIATTSNLDESLPSTNTQTTERDDVPTTAPNLYKTEVGWNTNQSHIKQEIEGDFLPRKNEPTKNEPTKLEIHDCLKQLRQVNTADDYWGIYEPSSQLVEEAWKLLNLPEQLRIQLLCNEGIDPLEQWLEGDRCLLWYPFAENKWGLATVKKVVRGACGFVYVLRDDGFGLHLGRDKLHLVESIRP
jgi:hypothetical protein